MGTATSQHQRVTVGPRHWLVAIVLLAVAGFVQAWSLFGALVPLGPCGLGVLHYDDRPWTVAHADDLTDQTAPEHWQGRGFVTSVTADRLIYRDLSGTTLTFVPGSVPTGCS